MSEFAFEIYIHVGPPKTATTSLQEFLSAHKSVLGELGWFYVEGKRITSSHHLPLRYLDWNPWIAGTELSQESLAQELATNFEDAKSLGLSRILWSSELFLYLSHSDWADLEQKMLTAAEMAGVTLAKVTLVYTRRDLEQRVSSWYAECLKHGTKIPRDQGLKLLREELIDLDTKFFELETVFSVSLHFKVLDFSSHGKSNNFIADWASEVIHPSLREGASEFANKNLRNVRATMWEQDQLLEFNQLNSPDTKDIWRPFVPISEASPQLTQGWLRLRMFHGMLLEVQQSDPAKGELARQVDTLTAGLAELAAEVDKYKNSLSWRVTKPLRALFGLLKAKP